MNQTEVNIEALSKQLDGAKAAKKKLERLARLCANKDFKDLILQDYCVEEAARLLHMSLSPTQHPTEQAKFLTMAQATGGVLMYINAQEQLLRTAAESIHALENELDDLRGEPEESED